MLARPLRTPLAVPRRSVSSNAAAARRKPITLTIIVPFSFKPELFEFESVEAIRNFVKTYNGMLKAPSPDKPFSNIIIPPRKFNTLSPTITYEILSPGWAGYQQGYHHTQVSDKAFEDKSRLALIAYMENEKLNFHELERIIKGPVNDVAEWEGVFDVSPNRLYLLDSKHSVSEVCRSFTIPY